MRNIFYSRSKSRRKPFERIERLDAPDQYGIRSRARRRDSGFTLLEMMVVVAIVGILVAVGLPKFIEFLSSSKLLTTTTSVLAKFREGSTMATAVSQNVGVVVDFGNNKVFLTLDHKDSSAPYSNIGEVVTAANTVDILGASNPNLNPIPAGGELFVGRFLLQKTYGTNVGVSGGSGADDLELHISETGQAATAYAAGSPLDASEYRTVKIRNKMGEVTMFPYGCGAPFAACPY